MTSPPEPRESKPVRSDAQQVLGAVRSYGFKEPAAFAGLAYFWLSAVGFACLFGKGMVFGINIIDLCSPSDFLVAGVRDPAVFVLASVTGWGLYRMWGKALKDARYPRSLFLTALALLVLGASLSGLYRYLVVFGPCRDWPGAPRALKVTTDSGEPTDHVRLAVTTSEFLVFGTPKGKTIVLPKGSIKRIDVYDRSVAPE